MLRPGDGGGPSLWLSVVVVTVRASVAPHSPSSGSGARTGCRGVAVCIDEAPGGQDGCRGSGGAARVARPHAGSADGCRSAVLGEGVQLAEQASLGGDEFVEGALFPDAAVVENDNPVGHSYVVEAMGDHDGDPVGGHGA